MWHAAPAAGSTQGPAASNGQGTLVVVGDSLMEGTAVLGSLRSRLVALKTWPGVVIDYKRGRTTIEGTRILARRLAANPAATAIIVALGTNDMLHHSKYDHAASIIDDLMQESLGLPVLWVNISYSAAHKDWRLRASQFNRALLAARAEWPNLSVADWSRSFVPAGRSNYIIDGIHLSNSGYRTRATWLAREAGRFGVSIVNSSTTTTGPAATTTTPVTTIAPTTVSPASSSTTTSLPPTSTTTTSPGSSTTSSTSSSTTSPNP